MSDIPHTDQKENISELVLSNKTFDVLIEGLEKDIAILKNGTTREENASQIVQLTMQLNIMKDKKTRNLQAINQLIKKGEVI